MDLHRAQIPAAAAARLPNPFACLICLFGCVCAVGLAMACDPRSLLTSGAVETTTTTPSFTLSVSPGSLTVNQDSGKSAMVMVGSQNGFTQEVSLSATGLPNGMVAQFSPAIAGKQSILNLTTTDAANPGGYEIAVAGAAGSLEANATLTIIVVPSPSFSLSASPNSLSFDQGGGSSTTITVKAQNGFKDNVSLYTTGLPKGVFASFSSATALQQSVLSLPWSDSATPAQSIAPFSGVAGYLQAATSLTLNIAPAPSFGLSASPASLDIRTGSSGSTTVTVDAINGFRGIVDLSAEGLPNGVHVAFSPASTGTTSTLELTLTDISVPGTYDIGITGVT